MPSTTNPIKNKMNRLSDINSPDDDDDFSDYDYATDTFRVRHYETDWIGWLKTKFQSKKTLLVSLVAFILVILLIAASSIVKSSNRTNGGTPDGSSLNDGIGKKKWRFDLERMLLYDIFGSNDEIDWIELEKDGAFIAKTDMGDIVLRHVAEPQNETVLARSTQMKYGPEGPLLTPRKWFVSKKLDWILLMTHYEKGWRHSFFGNYYLFDIETKAIKSLNSTKSDKIIPNEIGSGKISLTLWSSHGTHIAWIRDNDLYVTLNATNEFRVTTDGSKNVINGISDWVYEEEILESPNAMWFSPTDSYIAYIKFNDTNVMQYPLQYFEDPSSLKYPKEIYLKYPKPGTPNPIATLYVMRLKKSRDISVAVEFENSLPDEDRLFTEVAWLNKDILFVRMMNRVQDKQLVYIAEAQTDNDNVVWRAQLIRTETNKDGAWFNKMQSAKPHHKSETSGYFELQENEDGFAHVAYYKSPYNKIPTSWLTQGAWEVTEISSIDADKNLIYIVTTEISSTERHLYSVDLNTKEKKRISDLTIPDERLPPMVDIDFKNYKMKPSNQSKSGVYGASFSPGAKYFNLKYMGPGVPFSEVRSAELGPSKPAIKGIKMNEGVITRMKQYNLPSICYTTIKNENGDDMNVKMYFPLGFDPKGSRKYPVLMMVYGGPSSQLAGKKHEPHFMLAMADAGVIGVVVDGRGTGFKGRKYRSWVSNSLGKYEVVDQIAAAKYLSLLNFIDSKKIGIWGWSFGGFMASKVIEADSEVISLGMAVAPVTDWKYYDSVYTERYMKTPEINEYGYEKSAINDVKPFNRYKFLLVHGLSDDNVHFQNSAHFIKQLTMAGIKSYRVQVYTDEDHSLARSGPTTREVYDLLKTFFMESFNITPQT